MKLIELACLFKGHKLTDKIVLETQYCRTSMATCDRCGWGERDLRHIRIQALPFALRARAAMEGE